MKKITVLILLAVSLLVSQSVFAAATVKPSGTNPTGKIIEISDIDADWKWSTTFPTSPNIKVVSIEFIPGAANDRLVIKSVADTGPIIFNRICEDTNYTTIKYFFGASLSPFIDYSDCTLSPGHKVIITLGQ